MDKSHKFNFKSLAELKNKIKDQELEMPLTEDVDVLAEKVKISGSRKLTNRLVVQPMEGADANLKGTPSQLTERRYRRFVAGGAGMIWFEAVAVSKEGRANNRQLFINQKTVDSFADLVEMVNKKAKEEQGAEANPYLVVQLSHCGRFGQNKNILFHHDLLDKAADIDQDQSILTDEELEAVEDDFVRAARLAKQAGFDAVDIKSCHRYLLSESLAAHTREGKYGGSYQNRTRLLKNIINKIDKQVDIDLAVRFNVYDAIPYPYGWSTDQEGNMELEESRRLISELDEMGVKLINITASTPYLKPHINRPYDQSGSQGEESPESPLKGVERLIKLGKEVTKEVDNSLVVGTGYTWLRQFAPYIASGVIEREWAHLIGFGRQAFAYPDFAQDILEKKKLETDKICITCSKCAELKAAQQPTGCVIRDGKIYGPYYQKLNKEGK